MRFLVFGLLFLSAIYFSESFSIAKRDAKDDLVKNANALRDLAKKEIDSLKAQGKTALAAGLERADKVVLDIETQLRALNPITEVGKALLATLEKGLEAAETKLRAEITKLSGSFYEGDVKDELMKQADNLKKLAQDAIESLKAQGKTFLASNLEKAEKFVLDLETQVKNLNPTTELGKVLANTLASLLKKAETTLEAEIKQLSGSYYDAKDDLVKSANALRDLAKKEIETLKAQGKTALAAGLERADKVVLDIETQLRALNPITEVGKALLATLEKGLEAAETKLKAEITKLSGSFYEGDVKDELMKQADNLKNMAQKAIEDLKAQGKTFLASNLEKAEKFVLDLETQVKNLNPTTELGKVLANTLSALLKKAETTLEAEIKQLSGTFYEGDVKDELMKQADNLKKLAQDEIKKLKDQGKTLIAGGLEKAEKFILDLENQLKNLNPTTELGKTLMAGLEALLKNAETQLEAEIKKLSGSYYDEDLKNQLLIEAEKIKKLAQEEIASLMAQGKTTLAAGLKKAESVVLDIETQLTKLNPTTEVGKVALSALEALLKKADETLLAEIKKLSGSYYDAKDDLVKSANALRDLAKKEIETLKSQGKTALAAGLERADKVVLDIETQLRALNPTTDVGKALLATLEKGLEAAETKLKAEITKLSGSFYEGDVKDELMKQADNLKNMAQKAIEDLKAQGKTFLASNLEKAEKFVLDLETQVKNLNPTTELGKVLANTLSALLKKAETTLEAEIKQLSGSY